MAGKRAHRPSRTVVHGPGGSWRRLLVTALLSHGAGGLPARSPLGWTVAQLAETIKDMCRCWSEPQTDRGRGHHRGRVAARVPFDMGALRLEVAAGVMLVRQSW